MASYSEQILICTGKDDWPSRIEDDEEASGALTRSLKGTLGRRSKFSDPFHNVLITNSSFKPSSTPTDTPTTTGSAYLFPSFKFLPDIPLDRASLERFVRGFVLPKTLHPRHEELSSEEQRSSLVRDESLQAGFAGVRPVTEALVLICGHGSRDSRCGVMGPVLRAEFEEKLRSAAHRIGDKSTPGASDGMAGESDTSDAEGLMSGARVGLISHIGGHKYAGNVIIYMPPHVKHALAGCGIWYGRVRPEHVEGIVSETLLHGRIIKDLFRGGIDSKGKPIML